MFEAEESMITDTVTPDVVETLFQLSGGAVLPRCLQVVADLGVADALEDTPRAPPRWLRRPE